MNIAVLGTGVIGTTIGGRLTQGGNDVVYGVREPDPARHGDLMAKASVQTIEEAIAGADAVLIAIPGSAVDNLLEVHGSALDGKILLDASNDVGAGQFHHISAFEERVPAAHVFRAFNTLGWENFATPVINGEQVDLFYSGPEGDVQPIVERIIMDVGLRPIHVGAGVDGADLLDGITRLWFTLALRQGYGRHLAFRTVGL